MKRRLLPILAIISITCVPTSMIRGQNIWVTAYYGGWMQGWENYGRLPAEEIDYSALTHIVHFGLVPERDGTLDSLANSMTEVNSRELITRAHAAGTKVLISVGGWGTDVYFRDATNPLVLPLFVDNLVDFMTRRGYDGIDLDWEYLLAGDAVQYVALVQALRAKLNTMSPRPLLTAAAAWQPAILALVQGEFDQINIMTYDLSGAWPGWVSWHNSPLYDGGFRFPSTLRPPPSANGMVNQFIAAGVPASKLGIGIDFYGYVWNGGEGTPTGGVTEPRQSWSRAPFVRPNVPYYQIKQQYYRDDAYRWDSLAHAPYISLDQPGALEDRFISYCDEISCEKKILFAREHGLGGVFVWELGGGYLPSSFSPRDPLLQAIKQSVNEGALAPAAPSLVSPRNNMFGVSPKPTLVWSRVSGADSYRIQVSEDPDFVAFRLDTAGVRGTSLSLPPMEPKTAYYWRVSGQNSVGEGPFSQAWSFLTAKRTAKDEIPNAFALHQNFPNPFNSGTTISFDLPFESHVVLEIYSMIGARITTLLQGTLPPGTHSVPWSAERLTSGMYICRLKATEIDPNSSASRGHGTVFQSRRLVLLR